MEVGEIILANRLEKRVVNHLYDPAEPGHKPGRRGADDQESHADSFASEPDGVAARLGARLAVRLALAFLGQLLVVRPITAALDRASCAYETSGLVVGFGLARSLRWLGMLPR